MSNWLLISFKSWLFWISTITLGIFFCGQINHLRSERDKLELDVRAAKIAFLNPDYRKFTICSDGWKSSSNGRGTCSHHGGVSRVYERHLSLINVNSDDIYNSNLRILFFKWLIWTFFIALITPLCEIIYIFYLSRNEENRVASISALNSQSSGQSSHSQNANLLCPRCGSLMKIRLARKGPYRGEQFLGCSKYPRCYGTRKIPN